MTAKSSKVKHIPVSKSIFDEMDDIIAEDEARQKNPARNLNPEQARFIKEYWRKMPYKERVKYAGILFPNMSYRSLLRKVSRLKEDGFKLDGDE